jgi:hypothetical protein
MQLFYPCFLAQEIEAASQEMANNIYESDWLKADLATKKLMLIFMQNLSKPVITLNIFCIVDINLNTFLRVSFIFLIRGVYFNFNHLQIINATYSAYAVLNHMRE